MSTIFFTKLLVKWMRDGDRGTINQNMKHVGLNSMPTNICIIYHYFMNKKPSSFVF